MGIRWTEKDLEQLWDSHAEGLSFDQIADKLGRTLNAVRKRFKLLSEEKNVQHSKTLNDPDAQAQRAATYGQLADDSQEDSASDGTISLSLSEEDLTESDEGPGGPLTYPRDIPHSIYVQRMRDHDFSRQHAIEAVKGECKLQIQAMKASHEQEMAMMEITCAVEIEDLKMAHARETEEAKAALVDELEGSRATYKRLADEFEEAKSKYQTRESELESRVKELEGEVQGYDAAWKSCMTTMSTVARK